MEKILLLNSGKTKSGKTAINFGITACGNYKKGYEVLIQYIDDASLHDKFRDSDFGLSYQAEVGYRDTFNGQAVKIITKLVDDNGEIIFEV